MRENHCFFVALPREFPLSVCVSRNSKFFTILHILVRQRRNPLVSNEAREFSPNISMIPVPMKEREKSSTARSLVIRENNSFLKRPRKRASEFHAQFCRPTDLRSIRSLLQRKFQRRNDESGWERWGNVVKPWKHSAGCRRHDWVLPMLNKSFYTCTLYKCTVYSKKD